MQYYMLSLEIVNHSAMFTLNIHINKSPVGHSGHQDDLRFSRINSLHSSLKLLAHYNYTAYVAYLYSPFRTSRLRVAILMRADSRKQVD